MAQTRTRITRPRRSPFGDVWLRDVEELRQHIEESGQSLRRIAVTTRALADWKPETYDRLNYQTIQHLLNGRQTTLGLFRAQALEEALRLPAGTLFHAEIYNEQGSSIQDVDDAQASI